MLKILDTFQTLVEAQEAINRGRKRQRERERERKRMGRERERARENGYKYHYNYVNNATPTCLKYSLRQELIRCGANSDRSTRSEPDSNN